MHEGGSGKIIRVAGSKFQTKKTEGSVADATAGSHGSRFLASAQHEKALMIAGIARLAQP